jgi:hypothetical protein
LFRFAHWTLYSGPTLPACDWPRRSATRLAAAWERPVGSLLQVLPAEMESSSGRWLRRATPGCRLPPDAMPKQQPDSAVRWMESRAAACRFDSQRWATCFAERSMPFAAA